MWLMWSTETLQHTLQQLNRLQRVFFFFFAGFFFSSSGGGAVLVAGPSEGATLQTNTAGYSTVDFVLEKSPEVIVLKDESLSSLQCFYQHYQYLTWPGPPACRRDFLTSAAGCSALSQHLTDFCLFSAEDKQKQ